jgi:mono/diheme cytochrome c family protein
MFLALATSAQTLIPSSHRQAPTDLVITGLASGPQYLTRAQLLAMPQTTVPITHDENFAPGVSATIRGVPLETLGRALHALSTLDLIDLRCTDGYVAHLTAEFIAQHHPLLALTIDNQLPERWAAAHKAYDPGPYFITYTHFHPAFRVLAHDDYAQVPANITTVDFTTQKAVFTPLLPRWSEDSAVGRGFTIAKQNCLRCHSAGSSGGTKSRFSWGDLAQIARANPRGFARYILNPKSMNPAATMPPNSKYDSATLAALTAYFAALPLAPAKDVR